MKIRHTLEPQISLSLSTGVYHANGPERQQVVVLLAVAPGVPARVLALLQNEHLATEVYLLKANKAEERREASDRPLQKLFKDQSVLLKVAHTHRKQFYELCRVCGKEVQALWR